MAVDCVAMAELVPPQRGDLCWVPPRFCCAVLL